MKIKHVLLTLMLTLSGSVLAEGVDEKINEVVGPYLNGFTGLIFSQIPFFGGVTVPWVVIWLVIAATFFTIYFKFINLRSFRHGYHLLSGKYDYSKAQGEVTHFQALTTALSGTVGLGNIAGVAAAVGIGGAGATFWMIVCGFLGMSTKFVECTLGVKYRDVLPNGHVHGGPMRYLSKGFAEKGFGGVGKVLAVVFAICCIGGSLGGGNMFQVNQALEQVVAVTGGEGSFLDNNGWLFGLIVAVLVGITIIGGIKSIGKVTSKLVPFMGIIYVFSGLVVIAMNYDKIGPAFGAIIDGAFSTQSAFGGLVGVLIVGFQRAAFSNEAGIGSASIAHSAVKTDHPVTEGLVALYEPFIDTVVVCTITALVIGIAGFIPDAPTAGQGIALTSAAFGSAISWFPYVLTIAAVLFAFSTMLAWSYYGLRAFNYLFGHGKAQDMTYNILFLVFIVIGSSMSLTAVIGFSDAMIFAMSVPNLIGLYFLAPVVKRELAQYMAKIKSGEIKPSR
ncbi:alanine/glycine:cation symporter family protein [Marinicella sp. S1101]|uniref:alanine/glycine:cation symporter family protein n=1 Tax=Marinicella marina TaxID=2996016 RepID=UPI002260AFF0|nr:alanine/glycine:cation symporter family protein [Marinicella marina]MCX7554249.1 alanine/glycine:cation symporter family protein [Marinicella marina]MDJ1138758.1 alanine/glycine:cation symporter family protein [Marinicella marina]